MVVRDGLYPRIDVHWAGSGERIPVADEPDELLRCAHRHLAVAATQLASAGGCPADQSARYALAAARFRALTEQPWGTVSRSRGAAPFVRTLDDNPVPVADLFASACLRHRVEPRLRSIDRALVEEAKDLLRGLSWHVPALGDDPA